MDTSFNNEPDPIHIPVDGVLDLHTFQPSQVKQLLADYIAECQQLGIRNLRIIHGKGTGTLRELVHARLKQLPAVRHFQLADGGGGSWGATIVQLSPVTGGRDHKRTETSEQS